MWLDMTAPLGTFDLEMLPTSQIKTVCLLFLLTFLSVCVYFSIRVLSTAFWVHTVVFSWPARETGTVWVRCGPLWFVVACRPQWPWKNRPSVACSMTSQTGSIASMTPSGSTSLWATCPFAENPQPRCFINCVCSLWSLPSPGDWEVCWDSQWNHTL